MVRYDGEGLDGISTDDDLPGTPPEGQGAVASSQFGVAQVEFLEDDDDVMPDFAAPPIANPDFDGGAFEEFDHSEHKFDTEEVMPDFAPPVSSNAAFDEGGFEELPQFQDPGEEEAMPDFAPPPISNPEFDAGGFEELPSNVHEFNPGGHHAEVDEDPPTDPRGPEMPTRAAARVVTTPLPDLKMNLPEPVKVEDDEPNIVRRIFMLAFVTFLLGGLGAFGIQKVLPMIKGDGADQWAQTMEEPPPAPPPGFPSPEGLPMPEAPAPETLPVEEPDLSALQDNSEASIDEMIQVAQRAAEARRAEEERLRQQEAATRRLEQQRAEAEAQAAEQQRLAEAAAAARALEERRAAEAAAAEQRRRDAAAAAAEDAAQAERIAARMAAAEAARRGETQAASSDAPNSTIRRQTTSNATSAGSGEDLSAPASADVYGRRTPMDAIPRNRPDPSTVARPSADSYSATFPGAFSYNNNAMSITNVAQFRAIVNAINATSGPVRVVGHTDATGGARNNTRLGWLRANSVRKLLIRNGVSASRIVVESAGQTQPVATNETREGREQNRRVVLIYPKASR